MRVASPRAASGEYACAVHAVRTSFCCAPARVTCDLRVAVCVCVGAVLQREKRESITVPRGEGRGLTHNAGKGIDKMVTVPQTYPG